MNLQGRKIVLNKSVSELVTLLKDPKKYEEIMPEGLQKFESWENGFKFGLKGLPEISLKLGEITDKKATLVSASSSLDFELATYLHPLDAEKTEVSLEFNGKFNPFIKMMVEKPLKNFMEALTDKIESMFG